MKPNFPFVFIPFALLSNVFFFLQSHARIIYSFLYIKLSLKIYHLTARARERERESVNDVWSDDESAEKADRGERFVGFDRE